MYLKAFWIDRFPVTSRQLLEFLKATNHPQRKALEERILPGTDGARGSTDALAEGALARQRTPQHVSLEDVGEGCKAFCAVFGDRRWRRPVLDYVAPSMDWKQFEGRCSRRDKQIIRLKRAGWQQKDIASRLGVSPPAVNQRLGVLLTMWNEMTAA